MKRIILTMWCTIGLLILLSVSPVAPATDPPSDAPTSKREPKSDPNNLFKEEWMWLAGERVTGGSWDGSDAVRAQGGHPVFGVNLSKANRPFYEKLRGKWVKVYMDTLGGGFDLGLQELETKAFQWIAGTNSPEPKNWRRISHTLRFPSQDKDMLYFYSMGTGRLYDNIRFYILGTEPPELLAPIDQTWNPNLSNLIETPSFETLGEADLLPPGWHLRHGGARIVGDQGHTGKRSLLLMAASGVDTPPLEAKAGVVLRVHFWVRGRGDLAVYSVDLDAVGLPLRKGAVSVGETLKEQLPASDQWTKIELTSRSYNPDARGRYLYFTTARGSEIAIDDVQILRDTAVFPFSEKPRNSFTGEFTATGGTLAVTLGDQPLAEASAGITGPTVLTIKVIPRQRHRAVQVSGGLKFAEGGFVGPDGFWKMTTESPAQDVNNVDYDDSTWKAAPLSPDGRALAVAVKGPVWLRRVILWNTTPYLVPQVAELPFDVGRADWMNIALAPPLPTKIAAFQLLVDVPPEYRLLPYSASGTYLRAPETVEQDPRGAVHGGKKYRRFLATYNSRDITGVAGAYRGPGSRISMVLLELTGASETVEGKLFLTRVANGNAVDLPLAIDLVRVKLDGTRPKQVMIHDLWTNPYVVGNPPNAQLNIKAVDKIVQTCLRSGMTHSGWPTGVDKYLLNPDYGPRWTGLLRERGVQLMPVYHNFPFKTYKPGQPRPYPWPVGRGFAIADQSPGAVVKYRKETLQGKEFITGMHVSYAWLLSDTSREYWKALREEYRMHTAEMEKATTLNVGAYVWDYEFHVGYYAGKIDRLTLEHFANYAKLTHTPDWQTVQQKYSGQWQNFSKWACRQVIQRTYERVLKPLDLSFHVYYGYGVPFDRGNCDIISSWGIGQNIPGQIRSVAVEYKQISKGLKIDPDMRFLGILQAEIQALHRGRPFHWQEWRNNIVKRVIATHGGGVCLYTEVEPQCPGMPYGTAAATRLLAQWEPYFVKPEPLFAGKQFEALVQVQPAPADMVLLKRDGKGLLLLFGDEPEMQPEEVTITVTPARQRARKVKLAPMGLQVVELERL